MQSSKFNGLAYRNIDHSSLAVLPTRALSREARHQDWATMGCWRHRQATRKVGRVVASLLGTILHTLMLNFEISETDGGTFRNHVCTAASCLCRVHIPRAKLLQHDLSRIYICPCTKTSGVLATRMWVVSYIV